MLRAPLIAALMLMALALTTASYAEGDPAPVAGALVSLELKDALVADVLRALGQEHGIGFIIAEDATGRVTATIRDAPLWEAVDGLLEAGGLVRETLPGGMHLITRTSGPRGGGLAAREFRMDHVEPGEDVLALVRGMLSAQGTVGARGRVVMVKDTPGVLAEVGSLLEGLDAPPRQVRIEARILEVTSSRDVEKGVEWGVTGRRVSADVFGGLGEITTTLGASLAGPSEDAGGGALGFGLISGDVDVDVRISALEAVGRAEVLARPSVLVAEGGEALIAEGMEILVPNQSGSTVINTGNGSEDKSPMIFEAMLVLSVRPRVREGGLIALSIETRREEFDFSRDVQGYPPRYSRMARTEVLVPGGSTLALGGILIEARSEADEKVPLLGDLPVLGRLFRGEARSSEKKELVILITPSVYEAGGLGEEVGLAP